MSDWDGDSEQLRSNLRRVLLQARDHALERLPVSAAQARAWQSAIMQGLTPPKPEYVGRFRGEAQLEGCDVEIGGVRGTAAAAVAEELNRFEEKLQRTRTGSEHSLFRRLAAGPWTLGSSPRVTNEKVGRGIGVGDSFSRRGAIASPRVTHSEPRPCPPSSSLPR